MTGGVNGERFGRLRSARRVILALILAYAGMVLLLAMFQDSYIFVPDRRAPDPAVGRAGGFQTVAVPTSDGLTLHAWYAPPRDPSRPVVILFHGNGGNIQYYIRKTPPFVAAGDGFLLAEYRGYGGNPGHPDEANLYKDAEAYLGWLKGQGMPDARIVLFGQSIGTGVAVQMALEHPGARALVLESPFTKLVVIAQRQVPYVWVAPFLRNKFDNIGKIAAIHMPLLIVHGTDDRLVPYSEGVALFNFANQPKTLLPIPGGTHMNLASHGDARSILSFVDSLKTR